MDAARTEEVVKIYLEEDAKYAFPSPVEALVDGVLRSLHQMDIDDGDPYILKALATATAVSLEELYVDFDIAKGHPLYLENTTEINRSVEADPGSTHAMGWSLTLARAAQLGLDAPLTNWPPGDLDQPSAWIPANEGFFGPGGAANDKVSGTDTADTPYGGGNDLASGALATMPSTAARVTMC